MIRANYHRADFENAEAIVLVKRCETLRLTQQIAALVEGAATSGKYLVLDVGDSCVFDERLARYLDEHSTVIIVDRR